MSVVVTGAAGFIGRHVVRTLVGRGQDVIGVDRRPWSPLPGETALRAELSRPDDDVQAALVTAEAVVHLAGCPGVRDDGADVAWRRHRDNVLAGERVLAATPTSTPVVVASSSSVYGGSRGGRACHEDTLPRPVGGYARSKVALEDLCAARAAAGGRVAVVRPFTVAGEGQRPDMAIARWLDAASRGVPLRVLGSLSRTRDVTDVRDVSEGIVRVLERGTATVVNLGTGRPHTLAELVAAVREVSGGERLELDLLPAAAVEVPATRADTARCARLLGFVPRTHLPSLVARQHAAAAPTTPRPLEVV